MKRIILIIMLSILVQSAFASDTQRGQREFENMVKEGEKNFNDTGLSTNALACGQCHINGNKSNPQTYPKYKSQIGKVVTLAEMVNWCITNPLKGKALAFDSKKMVSLLSYIRHQSRGVKMEAGKD